MAVGPHDVPAGTVVTASLCAADRDPALATAPGDVEFRVENLIHGIEALPVTR